LALLIPDIQETANLVQVRKIYGYEIFKSFTESINNGLLLGCPVECDKAKVSLLTHCRPHSRYLTFPLKRGRPDVRYLTFKTC
jgi:hypothetical protein